MTRFFVYGMRLFDEKVYFDRYSKEMGMEYGYTEEAPSMDNYMLAEGYDAICILTHRIDAQLMDAFKSVGVKLIGTRSNGYDHIDVAHAKEIGMIVTNVTYDPIGIAEYTVLLMLMAVRNIKKIEARNVANDFRLNGMLGRSLGELKVGIVGAGAIGMKVLRILSGFGCETYYYNRSPSPAADELAHRLEFDELLETCDIVSIHLGLNGETYHKFNGSVFEKMKDDAVLINTARGAIEDTEAHRGRRDRRHRGRVQLLLLRLLRHRDIEPLHGPPQGHGQRGSHASHGVLLRYFRPRHGRLQHGIHQGHGRWEGDPPQAGASRNWFLGEVRGWVQQGCSTSS